MERGFSYIFNTTKKVIKIIDKQKLISVIQQDYGQSLNLPPTYYINLTNNSTYEDIVNNDKFKSFIIKNKKISNTYFFKIQNDNVVLITFDKTFEEIKKILGAVDEDEYKKQASKGPTNFYISDMHFGCDEMVAKEKRPFKNHMDMWETIKNNWNKKVRPIDDVYIIGDILYKDKSQYPAEWYVKQLYGKIHLLIGCHDHVWVDKQGYRDLFASVDDVKTIYEGQTQIMLCHYPLAEWGNMYRGSNLIFGHVHAANNRAVRFMKGVENSYNAGCMIHNWEPVTFEELKKNHSKFLNSLN